MSDWRPIRLRQETGVAFVLFKGGNIPVDCRYESGKGF